MGEDDRVFFYNEDTECDFVIVHSGRVDELLQVCWQLDKDNYKREFDGLVEASAATRCNNCSVISFEQEGYLTRATAQIDTL